MDGGASFRALPLGDRRQQGLQLMMLNRQRFDPTSAGTPIKSKLHSFLFIQVSNLCCFDRS